jgi:hypothetical protein
LPLRFHRGTPAGPTHLCALSVGSETCQWRDVGRHFHGAILACLRSFNSSRDRLAQRIAQLEAGLDELGEQL